MVSYDEVIATVRGEVQRGLTVQGAVVALKDAGLTLTQSIKALTELFGLSLGDAKAVTAGHPVWADVVRAAEPLHAQLEEMASRSKK